MSLPQSSDGVLRNERTLPFSAHEIFMAIARPELLARWWGPDGFTNTFERFEFVPDGRWNFTMHGPNGADYRNENVFRAIEPERCVVIEHVLLPHFTLTITLTARGDETHLLWEQDFGTLEIAAKFRPLCETANEQNLDRLTAVLAGEK